MGTFGNSRSGFHHPQAQCIIWIKIWRSADDIHSVRGYLGGSCAASAPVRSSSRAGNDSTSRTATASNEHTHPSTLQAFFGMFQGAPEPSDEDFRSAEFHGDDDDDGLDWS